MKSLRIALPLGLLALLWFAPHAHAWSNGHHGQTRQLLAFLPDELTAGLSEETRETAVSDWAKHPDNFDPLDKKLIGAEGVELLLAHDIDKRYDLHGDEARAVMFKLLVDALREGNHERAVFWLTCLTHAIGDMSATNHDPLVQKIVYHWIMKDFGASLGGGVDIRPLYDLLDLQYTADDDEGNEVFTRTIEQMRLADDGRDAETAVQEIMLYGHRGAEYMSERTGPIIEAATRWISEKDPEAERKVFELESELGAWAIVRVLRDLEVAQRLAAEGKEVPLGGEVFARFHEAELAFARERPLSDSMYAGLDQELSAGGGGAGPAIGVVAEPLWRMDRTFLGYNHRPGAAAIARSLDEAGRPYVLIDVRRMIEDGLPSPKDVPIVAIPGQTTTGEYLTMKRQSLDAAVKAYAEAGGKVIWLGGRPSGELDAIADAVSSEKQGNFGVDDDRLESAELVLVGGEGDDRWSMGERPKPTAGWGASGYDRTFETSDTLRPLVVWQDPGTGGPLATVGVVSLGADGKPEHAFLPHWAMWMHLLEDERVIPDPARPTLDQTGRALFFHTIDVLTGAAPVPAPGAAAPRTAAESGAESSPSAAADLPSAAPGLPDIDPAAVLSPVTVDGERLVRDGETVRYWGVNANLQPWVTADSVDAVVDRMAAMGFNAIRFWPNREAFYGVEPSAADGPEQGLRFVEAEKGDGSLLDLYDRFTARAKRRGLAIYNPALLYYPPYFADFVDVVETNPADRAGWVEALEDKSRQQVYNLFRVAQFFDERCQRIMLAHASNHLDHVNPYTGIRNADENNFTVWDLSNESRFVWQMLLDNEFRGDGHRSFGPYFTGKLTERWNAWLAERHGDDAGLRRAWGDLAGDESLRNGNVEPGTESPDGEDYGPARVEDFTAFAVELVRTWTQRFEEHVRSMASSPDRGVAVAAINADTIHVPHLANFSAASAGTSMAISTYPAPQQFLPGGGRDAEAPRFPWDPLVSQPFGLRMFNSARPAGMPLFVYETNYNGFALYDAEYPWIMAAFAAWQNHAGVFWHNFNHPGPRDIPAPWGEVDFAYREFEFWGDEVFSSALLAAGEAFKRGLLPVAEEPTVVTYRRDAAVDPAWERLGFDPEDDAEARVAGLPEEQADDLYDLIRTTAWTRGHRIAFTDDSNAPDVAVAGPLDEEPEGPVRLEPAPGLVWDWADERVVLDLPGVKAFAGFPDGEVIEWSDGFRVTGLDAPFAAIGLVSLDGRPLAESGRVRLSAVGHANHADMQLQKGGRARDEAALNFTELEGVTMDAGDGPVEVHRLSFTLELPPLEGPPRRAPRLPPPGVRRTRRFAEPDPLRRRAGVRRAAHGQEAVGRGNRPDIVPAGHKRGGRESPPPSTGAARSPMQAVGLAMSCHAAGSKPEARWVCESLSCEVPVRQPAWTVSALAPNTSGPRADAAPASPEHLSSSFAIFQLSAQSTGLVSPAFPRSRPPAPGFQKKRDHVSPCSEGRLKPRNSNSGRLP